MVASAFLPVALHQGELYFLFGKEAHDDSAPGFSDFGGRVEKSENIYEAGLREMAEETTGFLGGPEQIRECIERNGGVYTMSHGEYHIHLFRLDYDPKLVEYYNNNHRFVADRMDAAVLRKTMIFEKQEIQWMTVSEMRERRSEFRRFYQRILDKIIQKVPSISRFIRRRMPTRTTRRRVVS